MTTPVSGLLAFPGVDTGDVLALGIWRLLPLPLFCGPPFGGPWPFAVNRREDPGRRTGTAPRLCAMRILIGRMCFQGTPWKLPLAAALMLGLSVRVAGAAAALFTVERLLRMYDKRPARTDGRGATCS